MSRPFTFVWRKLVSLAVIFPLLALTLTISSVHATSTATISSNAAVPLPKTQKNQGIQYAMSSFRRFGSSTEEVEEVIVSKTTRSPSMKGFYHWYLDACIRRPFVAKGITSGTIAALGDVIAQNIEGSKSKGFSLSRVATFFFCNLLFTGPFIHLWYTFLNIVGGWMEKNYKVSKLKKTASQLFLDQTLGTIAFFPLYIFVFDVFESVIRLHRLPSLGNGMEKCRTHLWGIILTQYKVYPFSNMINFGLVPYELRVLFTSTVSLFWNIYLCGVVG
mmetsp:Transcript_7555/g.18586  ORF Transcript_7555/g.18586 Transcript_7555/m.18586 type:complete len:275 (+) Transcript_7555:131-955(+)